MSTITATLEQKFRVAIVGGGIGGLTCAIALKDCPNIEIDLYEQAQQITDIGAGITLWPRTWEILKSLGLEEDLLETLKGGHSDDQKLAFEHRISDRKDGFTFHKLNTKGGSIGFHRQELQQILLKHIPGFCSVHLSHRLIDCEEKEDGVELLFDGGLGTTCDVAFFADGIKSIGRELVPNEGIFNTGTEVFRALIPTEALAKLYPTHRALDHPIVYCGKDKHILAYPISRNRIVNFAALVSNTEDEGKPLSHPEIRDATTREVFDEFAGWEPEVMELLNVIEKPSRWVIRSLYPLNTYVSHRVALLGDAAHAMPPHLGAGAGQAIEDGYVLGRLFTSGGDPRKNVIAILKAYDRIRLPLGNMVKNNSREQGFNLELNAPGFENIKAAGQDLTPEQIDVLCKALTHNYAWFESDVELDLAKGIEFLKGATAKNLAEE